MNPSELSVVNLVFSGKLDLELELSAVAEDLRGFDFLDEVEHSRRKGNRLLIHFVDNDPLVILAPSGVYVVTGADDYEETDKAREYLFRALSEMGIVSSPEPSSEEVIDEFVPQNIVLTADVGDDINLDALAVGLGLEHTEYEPEQFPGLVYRPTSGNCTILAFSTGKVVVTGVTSESVAEDEFRNFTEKLEKFLDTS